MCPCGPTNPLYLFDARSVTTCLVCGCLALSPVGAKTPPASVVGHVLTAASSTGSLSVVMYAIPNAVTGNVHSLPVELPKPASHEPDR
jgi:dihydrodipicolinate synthase/N-acetylneuraminate lyase